MRASMRPDAADAADAFGAPRRRARRVPPAGTHWASRAVIALVGAAWLLLIGFTFQPRQTVLHAGSPHSSCEATGISGPAGREGRCARQESLLGPATVYNVVDRARVLQMPEYQARVISSTIAPTHVRRSPTSGNYYPHGHGWLVSFEIAITNTRAQPLQLGEPSSDTTLPLYPSHPRVELLIPPSLASSSSGSDEDIALSELVNGHGAPRPSIGLPRLIPGRGTITAWATFVAPEWSRELLDARPADLDFSRTDNDAHYVGQIRLWK
jgi:hypothetical protein